MGNLKPSKLVNRLPPPPRGLSKEAKATWTCYVEAYDLDPPALLLLAQACTWHDAELAAKDEIKKDGATVLDRFGQKQQHPACRRQRDAAGMYLKIIRQLGLDLEPLNDGPGRPAGSR